MTRYKDAKKITLIGAWVNLFLGFSKIWGGFLFHSHALIADGIHSFSDLLIDGMILFAAKFGSQDADLSHPYGHRRIETTATLFLSVLLIIAGASIAWDAFEEVFIQHVTPSYFALIFALFSLLANEILFRYTLLIGKRIKSAMIIANAWHHRSDAASSAVVAIGLIGSFLGFAHCDALAAIIVGFLIIKMGVDYGWNSIKELIDTAVDSHTLLGITTIIEKIDGVKKIHQLRSRSMGGDILIDVHILVEPFISVSEGHYIAQQVHHCLVNQVSYVKDVVVHVDPEDDEMGCPSLHLPNRKIIEQELLIPWQQQAPALKYWTLHYLDGKVRIDLSYDAQDLDDMKKLKEMIEQDLLKFPFIDIYLIPQKAIQILSRPLCT